jgi:hypothetical protein
MQVVQYLDATESNTACLARYLKHLAGVGEAKSERMRTWHRLAARGLYAVMVDRVLAGDEEADAMTPGGMPHCLLY